MLQAKDNSSNAAADSAAAEDGFSRRDFIKGGVAAGVVSGVGLGSVMFGYGSSLREPVARGCARRAPQSPLMGWS